MEHSDPKTKKMMDMLEEPPAKDAFSDEEPLGNGQESLPLMNASDSGDQDADAVEDDGFDDGLAADSASSSNGKGHPAGEDKSDPIEVSIEAIRNS